MPEHELANTENIKEVRVGKPGSAKILFESGIDVNVNPTEITDPAASFAAQAARRPDVYSTATIKGVPAKFVDPEAFGGREGGAWLVTEGFNVIVEGNGCASLTELKEIAESLRDYR